MHRLLICPPDASSLAYSQTLLFLRQATKYYRLLTRAAYSIPSVLGANHLAVFKRVRAMGVREGKN
jgi:hypothetical protein